MINGLKQKFIDVYGEGGDIRIFQAAGRVNLIGEHIDYNGGQVFPAALSLRCLVAARKLDKDIIRLAATTLEDRVELDITKLDSYRDLKFGQYQAGVAYVLEQHGFTITGCELLFDCDIPFGSGLSSSAAIEVATAFALAVFSLESGNRKPVDLVELALLCKEAENTYAGVNCGIMDQFASALGRAGHAVLLDCDKLNYSYVPLNLGEYQLIIADTKKPRSLQDSKYNERRQECDEAYKFFKEVLPEIEALCDVLPEQFEKHKEQLPQPIRNRCQHAVYEEQRVIESVKALLSGDIVSFAEYLNQSHYSLRDLYEVTGAELDALTDAARKTEGCIGSRMTGAGFGGSTVSIVHRDHVEAFKKSVAKEYTQKTGLQAVFYQAEIADGAKEIF